MSPRDGGSRGPRGTAQTQGKNSHPASGSQVISIATAVRKTATAAAPQPKIIPPPGQPMPVARLIVKELYTNGVDLVLRDHGGNFYAYDGTHWPEIELRIVKADAYSWLEPCEYKKKGRDGLYTIEPWAPTSRKVSDLLDALRAVTIIKGGAAPMWTSNDGQPPAREIVSMTNGLLHVPARELLPHTPRFFNHHALPFAFDPNAPEPEQWLAFLNDLWPDDPSAIGALQEMFGYVLGGDTRQQKMFLMVGPKRAGKGTIGRVLTGLLGPHNVAAPTMASLATNFGLSPLIDRPLALISDARLSGRTDAHIVVERLLSVSGEDSITVDRKYREPWTGRLPTRFLILTNEFPRLSDSSGALVSRFVPFVLTKSFYKREDPALTDRLLTEAPAIFNWALNGLDRLNGRGYFEVPGSSREAIQHLEDLSSPISAFLRDRCVIAPDKRSRVDRIWELWKEWCSEEGRAPGTKTVFGRDLAAAAPVVRRGRPRNEEGKRIPTYDGLGIRGTHNPVSLGTLGTDATEPDPVPNVPKGQPMYSPQETEGDHRCATGCGRTVGRAGATCFDCKEFGRFG